MRAPFSGGDPGEPEALFEGSWLTSDAGGVAIRTNWDVHPDGTSFVFVRRSDSSDGSDTPWVPIEVAVNWFEELRRLVPN